MNETAQDTDNSSAAIDDENAMVAGIMAGLDMAMSEEGGAERERPRGTEAPKGLPEEQLPGGFDALSLSLASADRIREWSSGEVKKKDTLDFKKAELPVDGGLFCQQIFGPVSKWSCRCGRYRGQRTAGVICPKCKVQVDHPSVRRYRMGHIELEKPVVHSWYMAGNSPLLPRILSTVDQPMKKADLAGIIGFDKYIVLSVSEDILAGITEEAQTVYDLQAEELEEEIAEAEEGTEEHAELVREHTVLGRAFETLCELKPMDLLPKSDSQDDLEAMHDMELHFGEFFAMDTGPEAVGSMLDMLDLKGEEEHLSGSLGSGVDSSTGRALTDSRRAAMSKRLNFVRQLMASPSDYRNCIMSCIPVLPPELRPMVELPGGRRGSSDLNLLYAMIIDTNNWLRTLNRYNSAIRVIEHNHRRRLQHSVDCLIANSRMPSPRQDRTSSRPLKSLTDSLEGKHGAFRNYMLGKRVNYSARSVIVVNPNLRLDQCGVPKTMALEVFKPFIMNALLDEDFAATQQQARSMIDIRDPAVWQVLPEVAQGRKVLLNRAPTLHRLGVQAFETVLVDGKALQIHPLVCAAFNADFDGDTMSLHLPLSAEAQAEADVLMTPSANLLSPANGRPTVSPSQDIVIGINYLTRSNGGDPVGSYESAGDALAALAAELISEHDPIEVEGIGVTTAGRVRLHSVLPEGSEFVNEQLVKSSLDAVMTDVVNSAGADAAVKALDAVKDLGFAYATRSGLTISMEDLPTLDNKDDLLEKYEVQSRKAVRQAEKGVLTVSEANSYQERIWREAEIELSAAMGDLMDSDPDNNISMMVGSGARGNKLQMRQIAIMKNLVQNPRGQIIPRPIKSSYAEGLSVLEYFMATPGARKGLTDTALRTADSGYLTRRLVEVCQDLITNSDDPFEDGQIPAHLVIDNVRPDDGVDRSMLETRLLSRCLAVDVTLSDGSTLKAGSIVGHKEMEALRDDETINSVKVLSPLTDRSERGMTRWHYGADLSTGELVDEGVAVGVIAAQSIGEPGTQLTMRTFHTGGVAMDDIAAGLPQVVNLFEARTKAANRAVLAPKGGVVSIEDKRWHKRVEIRDESDNSIKDAVRVPGGRKLLVDDGDLVTAGTPLCTGIQDPNDVLALRGMAEAQRYLVNEIQNVYRSQGVSLHDKHVECIVRQMSRHVEVTDPGGTGLEYGKATTAEFTKANAEATLAGVEPAKGRNVILPITRAAMESNSWLAVCSFQESIRSLFEAALMGTKDTFEGLKSNVLMARRIPVGSGYEGSPAHAAVEQAAAAIQVSRPHRFRKLAAAREEFDRKMAEERAMLEATSLSDVMKGVMEAEEEPLYERERNDDAISEQLS